MKSLLSQFAGQISLVLTVPVIVTGHQELPAGFMIEWLGDIEIV